MTVLTINILCILKITSDTGQEKRFTSRSIQILGSWLSKRIPPSHHHSSLYQVHRSTDTFSILHILDNYFQFSNTLKWFWKNSFEMPNLHSLLKSKKTKKQCPCVFKMWIQKCFCRCQKNSNWPTCVRLPKACFQSRAPYSPYHFCK